jgi:hypothetical protein
MMAAGVRLCAREGVVRLPDEESLLLVGGPEVDHMGLEVDISLNEGVDLAPGDSVIVPVRSRRADSSQVQIWAGRGDQWVTQLLYGPGRRPKAVKVVNVSERIASLHHHTVVACLIERNYLPTGGRFARPKSRKYKEWEQLIALSRICEARRMGSAPGRTRCPTSRSQTSLLVAQEAAVEEKVPGCGPLYV